MSPSFKHPRSWFSKDVGFVEGGAKMAAASPAASLTRYSFQQASQAFFTFVPTVTEKCWYVATLGTCA